jgi:hypothetical protein
VITPEGIAIAGWFLSATASGAGGGDRWIANGAIKKGGRDIHGLPGRESG